MKNNMYTYFAFQIPKWFVVFILLFSISGYSNYTSPNSKRVEIELVVPTIKNTQKTVSFQRVLIEKPESDSSLFNKTTSLELLSLFENRLTLIKSKNYQIFDYSFTEQNLLTIQSTSNTSEEDFFPFYIG